MKKILAFSAVTASLLSLCMPAQSQVVAGPVADATAVDNTHFGAIVAIQCALTSASASTETGAGGGTITPYTAIIANLGPDFDADAAASSTEPRVLSLIATESSTFNCNTDNINLTVALALLFPVPGVFTNAVDFNYTTEATPGLMDHLVTLAVTRTNNDGGSPNAGTENLGAFDGLAGSRANAAGQLYNNAAFAGDDEANFDLAITSNFVTTAEELGAGTYETAFTITAVAQ